VMENLFHQWWWMSIHQVHQLFFRQVIPQPWVSMGTAAPSQAVDVARAVCLATAAAFESGPPEGQRNDPGGQRSGLAVKVER
jgi:hypothetical protein